MAKLTLSFYIYQATPKNKTTEFKKTTRKNPEKPERIVPFAPNTPLWEAEEFQMWHDLMPAIEAVLQDFPDIIISEDTLNLEEPQIMILFVKSNDLTSHAKLLDDLAQSKFRDTVHPEAKEKLKPNIPYQPIITIGYPDITYLHSEEKDDQQQKDWNNMLLDSLDLDKRFKFLDSSIWHRYVPVVPYDATFEEVLEGVLKEINTHYEEGLYCTNAAVISLEFQMRMLLHSYVAKFGYGGHSEVLTPFKFHSEYQMRKKADKEIAFLKKDWGNNSCLLDFLQWRMLLVDDQASKLSFIDKNAAEKYKDLGKKALLLKPLENLYASVKEVNKNGFTIEASAEYNSIIQFATKKLFNNTYDIIFLDHLLNIDAEKGVREYGADFLLELLQDNRDTNTASSFQRDLSGKYWIFPISSYPYAFFDKLTQLGISHLQEIWHIAQGGDPLSTPHLYAHNLFRFMKQRISKYFLYPTALRNLLNQIPLENNIENRLWTGTLLQSIETWEKKMKLLDKIHFDKNSKGFSWSIRTFIKTQKRNYLNSVLKEMKNILNLLDGLESKEDEKKIKRHLDNLKAIDNPSFNDILEVFEQKVNDVLYYNLNIARNEIKKANDKGETYLSLANLGIYELPAEINSLKDLEYLNLEGNYLAKLPPQLETLKKIISIDLRKNRFTEFPKELFELECLESINLSNNRLYKLPEYPDDKLVHLEYLNLHNNFLKFTKRETEVKELWTEAVTNSNESQLKTKLYSWIAKDDLPKAITVLMEYNKDESWKNELTQIRGRYISAVNYFQSGFINYESYTLQINNIRRTISSYVENVKE